MAETTTTRVPLHSTHRNFFGHINVAIVGMTNFFSQQELRTSTSCHAVLAFIVPALLNFLQLKCQGKDVSPFETHPKSMGVAVASLLLYCFVYDAELRSSASHSQQTYAFIARRWMVLFGWLAVVSMESILLPGSVGPVLYFLYVLFSAGVLLCHRLQRLWKWLHQILMGRVPLTLPSWFRAHAFSNTRAITRPRV